jgi:hypothetical protein
VPPEVVAHAGFPVNADAIPVQSLAEIIDSAEELQ